MKTVLCYGDSNTWGYDPGTRSRFPSSARWTGVLADRLGADYHVIEERLNGRNGLTYLRPCVESHEPLDLIIIMLGTNDLKHRFNLAASDIAQSAAALAEEARRLASTADGAPAKVLLVAPPPTTTLTEFDQLFAGAQEKSRQLSHYYRLFAGRRNVPFFDAGSEIVSSEKDGIHFDAEEHRKLGEALAGEVRRLIS